MIALLILFIHVVMSPLKAKARLEAEIIVLRHQLNILHRRVSPEAEVCSKRPTALRLALSAVSVGVERGQNYPTGHRRPVASVGFSTVLALEVALSGRSADDTPGNPQPDPRDEPGQSAVGCAPHPW